MKKFFAVIATLLLSVSCNLVQKSNEIWYSTLDNGTVELHDPSACGAEVVLNTNKKGWGVVKFDAPIVTVGADLMRENGQLCAVSLPSDVTSIDQEAFADCTSLKSVTMFDKVTYIGHAAFKGCSTLADITLSKSLATVWTEAFSGCGFIGITLPHSVTEIGAGAFRGCNNLISATLSGSVAVVGEQAFAECPKLEYVYCKSLIPPVLEEGVFQGASAKMKIYVPNESLDLYKWASSWRGYKHRIIGFDFK